MRRRDVVLAPVEPHDAGELLTLQQAAHVTEARLYGDPHLLGSGGT